MSPQELHWWFEFAGDSSRTNLKVMVHDFRIGNTYSVAFEDRIIAICSSASWCYIDWWSKLLLIRKGLQKVQGCPHLSCCSRILCTGASGLHHLYSPSMHHYAWFAPALTLSLILQGATGGSWFWDNMWNNSHGPFIAYEQGPGGEYPAVGCIALLRCDENCPVPSKAEVRDDQTRKRLVDTIPPCQKKHFKSLWGKTLEYGIGDRCCDPDCF